MAICAGCGEAKPTVDVEAQLLEADRMFLEGNYEEVIPTLETVLEAEPATVRGYLRLSDAYIARGEENKALELLQRGLELTDDEEIAARIQGMTEDITGVVDVVASGDTTFVIDESGAVYWFGRGKNDGHKVDAYTVSEWRYATIPEKLGGLEKIAAISRFDSSNDRGMTVNEQGELFRWGWHNALENEIGTLEVIREKCKTG